MSKEISYTSISEMKERASILNQGILNMYLSPNPKRISELFDKPFIVSLGTVATKKNGDVDINFALGIREFMDYDEIKNSKLVLQLFNNGVRLIERYLVVGMKLIPCQHGRNLSFYGDDCASYYPNGEPIDVEEILKEPKDFDACKANLLDRLDEIVQDLNEVVCDDL